MTDSPIPIDWFDYDLPEELIAQHPVEPRDAARMLVVDRARQQISDRVFHDLPEYLQPGDLIVVNDTRVLRARLFAQRETGGRVEFLLLQRSADGNWTSLARPARRLRDGERLRLVGPDGQSGADIIEVVGRSEDAVVVRFDDERAIDRAGRVPLPPYIHEDLGDPERYQTVYARETGSAAAPTAGMHFTPELMRQCEAAGIRMTSVTLHVGLGTFQPIKTQDVRDHPMHAEVYAVEPEAIRAIREARANGGRILAVGTTSVRTLESIADRVLTSEDEGPVSGSTRLYITPGYEFQLVDRMITNFHLPRTTLLLLVASIMGEDLMRRAYAHAVRERYRFYSFGDAMLIV
ncbi:MAG: tRNA preQ1(34) S-adenosylmethionine ribosyltransferase-isomerase QueA [Thermomicrobiales bacterium]|nr:tRNA preQ1(34) S-adenosylmethionine ribosyltransferase-isomerase QueA [Thermomicrobiales bacterium]